MININNDAARNASRVNVWTTMSAWTVQLDTNAKTQYYLKRKSISVWQELTLVIGILHVIVVRWENHVQEMEWLTRKIVRMVKIATIQLFNYHAMQE